MDQNLYNTTTTTMTSKKVCGDMQISTGTIFLSEHCYNYVNEIRIKGKFKNMSFTINQIIGHYESLTDQHQKLVRRIQELSVQNQQLQDLVNSYRGQIVNVKV